MLNIREIRNLAAAKERSKSVPARCNITLPESSALESGVPKPPLWSDFFTEPATIDLPKKDPASSGNLDSTVIKSTRRLSSASFLQEALDGIFENESKVQSPLEEDSQTTALDVLLSYPVYSRYLRLLPMKDLLALGQTSRGLLGVVRKEMSRIRRHLFEFLYRKEFIRYLNLSFGSQKWITERQVLGPIFNNLYIQPEHILVFYSPDIFHYDLRIVDYRGFMQNNRPDHILDAFMRQDNAGDLRVWHFRLFSVIRPLSDFSTGVDHSTLTRLELNRIHLWHSEDLAMILLPSMPNVDLIHNRLSYSDMLDLPSPARDRSRSDLNNLLLLIEAKYSPKFLLLTARDIALTNFSGQTFDFPVILFENQVFEGSSSEEWMCFRGDVSAYQVILDVADSRETRDMKLHALHAQWLGVPCPTPTNCWLLYFTEMWPGGTSKEIPQCDILTLRGLFRGVPVFGGRAKLFMGNQYVPILSGSPLDSSKALHLRPTPTIVTILCFGGSTF